MAQFATRVDNELAAAVDALVEAGAVASRSEAVRTGLVQLVDRHRHDRTANEIVQAYRRQPQTDPEVGWADEATIRMVATEPW